MQKKYLSPEYLTVAQEYRDMRTELNKILRKKKAGRTEAETKKVDQLRQSMKDNAQQQKILLQKHLSNVSTKILSSSFRFNLTPDASKDPLKPLYSIGATAEEFFAMQVLCRNVKKLFKITMSSRHEILSQLKRLLSEDKSRYYIIRTDVCHCFESIPHDKLFGYLEGNNLGNVKDIILNEKFKIDSIVVDSKEYLAKSVVSYNNDNLIINSSGIKFNKESHQPKTAKVKLNNLVTIMPKINLPKINFPKIEEVQPSVTESKPNYKISNNPLPQRVVSDQNYLIGRKVSKTVYGINNEIIIKKDNIITDKTIQNAKLHNKLVELAVFSKLKENI